MEAEAAGAAAKMAPLRAADWLRARVSELEVDWSRVNSALSKLQELLQQRLLDRWPPVRILPDLQVWFQGLENRLIHEKETAAKAENATRLAEVLQNYQVCLAVADPGSVPGTVHVPELCFPGVKGGNDQRADLTGVPEPGWASAGGRGCRGRPLPKDSFCGADWRSETALSAPPDRRGDSGELRLKWDRPCLCWSLERYLHRYSRPPRLWFCAHRSVKLSRCAGSAQIERRHYGASAVGRKSRNIG